MTLSVKKFVIIVTLVFLAGSYWILLRNQLNNDVSWYLYVARELLSGKRLNIDIIETNPPLICYLTVVPAWIAGTFHADEKLVWIALLLLFTTAMSACAAWFWSRSRRAGSVEANLTFLFLIVLNSPFFFAYDSGQRDHLAFMSSVVVSGMIAARMAGVPMGTPAVAVSVITGLLLALKPFFLIPWLLCTVYAIRVVSWKNVFRWRETWIVPAMSLTQPLLIVFVTPSYLAVARLVSQLYSAYNTESWITLLTGRFLLMALTGVVLIFIYSPSQQGRIPLRLAGYTALGWYMSGVLQRKGWHYHELPAVAAVCFALWLVLWDSAEFRLKVPQRSRLAAASVAAFLAFAAFRTARLHWDFSFAKGQRLALLRQEAYGRRMIGLSTGMFLFPFLNEVHGQLATRYSCLWQLPGLYAAEIDGARSGQLWRYRRPEEMDVAEKEMFNNVASELTAEPALVLIYRGGGAQGMGPLTVDLESYFSQDARVRQALTHYESLPTAGEYIVLRHRGS